MARTWEQEKAYMARRAMVLGRQMDNAIELCDKKAFMELFTTAMNYMKKAERRDYWLRFRTMAIKRREALKK